MSTCGRDCSAVGGNDPCSAPSCYQKIVRHLRLAPTQTVALPSRRPVPQNYPRPTLVKAAPHGHL